MSGVRGGHRGRPSLYLARMDAATSSKPTAWPVRRYPSPSRRGRPRQGSSVIDDIGTRFGPARDVLDGSVPRDCWWEPYRPRRAERDDDRRHRPAATVRAAERGGRRRLATIVDRRDRARQPAHDGQRDPLPLRQPEVRGAVRPAVLPVAGRSPGTPRHRGRGTQSVAGGVGHRSGCRGRRPGRRHPRRRGRGGWRGGGRDADRGRADRAGTRPGPRSARTAWASSTSSPTARHTSATSRRICHVAGSRGSRSRARCPTHSSIRAIASASRGSSAAGPRSSSTSATTSLSASTIRRPPR